MKKTLIIAGMLVAAVSGYSQGSISFGGYISGTPSFKQAIYNVQTTAPANGVATSVTYGNYTISEYTGSSSTTVSANENPAGTVAYASGTALSGTGFDATLFGVAGTASTYNALSPLSTGVLNFYTVAAGLGFIQNTLTVTVPGTSSGAPGASVAIAAWQATGADGAATSLSQAQQDGYAWGFSPITTISTTFSPAGPASMTTLANLDMSFSLGQATPEPSTIALGVMGASALLFRRRK